MTISANELFIFAAEETKESKEDALKDLWMVMIVDDNKDVHDMTKFVLKGFNYEGKELGFIDAYSAKEAKELLLKNPNIDLILLDVVMESDDAGLRFVEYVREELNDKLIRIILRTGQPGLAPEKIIITEYDINDYKQKAETSTSALYTSLVVAFRNLISLKEIESLRKEQEQIARALMRFVSYDFLTILDKKIITDIRLGDYIEKDITILFLDIRAFTTLSEFLLPLEIFKFINDCMSYIGPIIIQNNGFVDKFIGDALMALFPGSAEDAVKAGIQVTKIIQEYNRFRVEQHQMPIKIGVSINTGPVVLGTVGYSERMDCTALGDAVNIAAKIEKLNKHFGSNVLISEETFNTLQNPMQFHFRYLGRKKLPGKKIALGIYEIYDFESDEIIELKQQSKKEFNNAVKLYYSGNTAEAKVIFKKILAANIYDTVCRYFIEASEN